jgi:hypothetical protein
MAGRFHVLKPTPREHNQRKQRVTCVTCQLKKCIGQCRWESVTDDPLTPPR